jgi:hypothetical protein
MSQDYRVNIRYEGRDYQFELSEAASDKSGRSSLGGKFYSLHMTPENPKLTAQLLEQMQLPTSTSIEGIVRNFTHISHIEDVHLVITSKTNEVGLSNLTWGAFLEVHTPYGALTVPESCGLRAMDPVIDRIRDRLQLEKLREGQATKFEYFGPCWAIKSWDGKEMQQPLYKERSAYTSYEKSKKAWNQFLSTHERKL